MVPESASFGVPKMAQFSQNSVHKTLLTFQQDTFRQLDNAQLHNFLLRQVGLGASHDPSNAAMLQCRTTPAESWQVEAEY